MKILLKAPEETQAEKQTRTKESTAPETRGEPFQVAQEPEASRALVGEAIWQPCIKAYHALGCL